MSRGTKYVWYRILFWMVVTVSCIEADYVVYILMRLPLISQCFVSALDAQACGWCTERVNAYLVYRARRHAVSTTGAVIIYIDYIYCIWGPSLAIRQCFFN